jgi:uncharacterized membrane protein YeaQ/YmgE (transglycosylase-associated protein family)
LPAQALAEETIMTVESLLIWLLIGAIAGWLAGLLVKGGGFGLVGNIVVGVLGAFVGGWLFPHFGVALGGGIVDTILFATGGAVVLLLVVSVLKRT